MAVSSSSATVKSLSVEVNQAVAAAKGGQVMAPVHVWVPNVECGRSLHRRLANDAGVVNVRFLTSTELAAAMVPVLERPSDDTRLTADIKRELVRSLLPIAQPPLSRQATPLMVREVVKAFDHLRTLTAVQLEGVADASPLAGELVRMYGLFRERCGVLHDDVSIMTLASRSAFECAVPVVAVRRGEWSTAEAVLAASLEDAGSLQVIQLDEDWPLVAKGEAVVAVDVNVETNAVLDAAFTEMERGTALTDMAIVHPPGSTYPQLLHSRLQSAGVPWRGRSSSSLAETMPGRLAMALVSASVAQWNRDSVLSLFGAAPLRQHGGGTELVPGSAWERRIMSARCGEDGAEMLQRLDALGESAICTFVHEVRSDESAAAATWDGRAQWLLTALTRLLAPEQTEEATAVVDVRRRIAHLARLDAIGTAVDAQTFESAVVEELRQNRSGRGDADGLFVGSWDEAIGARFEAVFACGLTEGTDAARRAKGLVAALEVPGAEQSGDGFEASLLTMLNGADRCVLAMARTDSAAGREARPSPTFVKVASQWRDLPVTAEDVVTNAMSAPWLTVLPSLSSTLRRDRFAPLPLMDRLSACSAGGLSALQDDELEQRALLVQSRNGATLTEFDGHTGPVALEPMSSATGFEQWVKCPFSYYLSKVLGVTSDGDSEEEWRFLGIDRGNLVHHAMQEFFAEDDLPGRPDEPWSDGQRRRLHQIVDGKFREAQSEGRAPKGLLYRHEVDIIHSQLDAVLDHDEALRRIKGTVPTSQGVELSFGHDEATAVSVSRPNKTPVTFRGRIDRVDGSPDGTQWHAFDYKTSKPKNYKDLDADNPVGAGKHLQLAIYAAAMRRMHPDAQHVSASYWFVGEDNPDDRVKGIPEGPYTEAKLAEAVNQIASGIEGGVFPAYPGKEDMGSYVNCRNCQFDSVCTADRFEAWLRKMEDPVVEPFVSMGGPS